MSLPSLSEFVKSGDVSTLLRVGGKGNRLEFLPETVDVLAAFFPQYKGAKGRLPQAAAMLRSFLKQENGNALVPVSEFRTTAEGVLTPYADDAVRLLREISETLNQQNRPPVDIADEVFTAQEAAAFLRCSVSTLRRLVPPSFRLGRSPRWRRSALLSL